jgi:hypothetical protein
MKKLLSLLSLLLCAAPALAQTATSFSATVPNVGASTIQLQGGVPGGQTISYQAAGNGCASCVAPTKGTISAFNSATGVVVYTPNAGFVGTDSFTFTVTASPSGTVSSQATVSVTITNAKTRIIDTLLNPDGTPRAGKATFVLTQTASTLGGLTPVSSSVTATLDGQGKFDVQLYPSTSLSPQAYYQLWFADNTTLKRELIGVYEVPATTAIITLAPYKVTDTNKAARYSFADKASVDALTSGVYGATTSPLANLSGYAFESLPAAGTAGRMARLTNRNRAAVLDSGSAWADISGGSYDPLLFGAKCDGTTDDSAAFEAIEAAMPAGGGTIRLPAGTCAINAGAVDIAKPVRIIGHRLGSIIRRRERLEQCPGCGINDPLGPTLLLRGSNSMLEDFMINAANASGTLSGGNGSVGDGLVMYGAHVRVTGVYVQGHRGHGLTLGSTTTYYNVNGFRFESVRTHENTGNGLQVVARWLNSPADPGPDEGPDANVGTVDSCVSFNNSGDGFYLQDALYNTFVNLSAEGNAGYGIRFGAGAGQNILIGGDFEGNDTNNDTGGKLLSNIRFDDGSFANFVWSPLISIQGVSVGGNAGSQNLHLQDTTNFFSPVGIGQYAQGNARLSLSTGPCMPNPAYPGSSSQRCLPTDHIVMLANDGDNGTGVENSSSVVLGAVSTQPFGGARITARYNFAVSGDDTEISINPFSELDSGVLKSITATPRGNVVLGHAGLATNAANGFVHIPSTPGTPTGTPATTYANREPIVIDRTNYKLHAYLNGAWRDLTGGGGGGSVNYSLAQGRLTTESGVPASASDHTAQSTIYFTPYQGNRIALYSGSAWAEHTFTERSLALSGLTADKNYDVFLYDNSGTLTLELSAAWTNNTTRADALALQDGVWVKSGAPTRRYLGTIRTTGTTTTEDSRAKRFVWNYYNRLTRPCYKADEADHTYAVNSERSWGGAVANTLVEFVYGLGEDGVTYTGAARIGQTVSQNGNFTAKLNIDGTTIGSIMQFFQASGTGVSAQSVSDARYVPAGYHYAHLNENSENAATGEFFEGSVAATIRN